MTKAVPPIITWDDSWSVGHAEIDADHKRLVELIQFLFGAIITVQGASYIGRVINELLDYTDYHFNREIEILESIGYDQVDHHRNLHKQLLQRVTDFCEQIKSGGASEGLSEDAYKFLRSWLTDHMLEEDMLYKPFLTEAQAH